MATKTWGIADMNLVHRYSVSTAALALTVFALSAEAQPSKRGDACFTCTGQVYFHANMIDKEPKVHNETAAFCFNPETLSISLLSEGIAGGYTSEKVIPESEISPKYFYWVSKKTETHTHGKLVLRAFVEFVDVKNLLQVVKRDGENQPRIAFNGYCQETRRLP